MTLTQTAIVTKKLILFSVIALVLGMISYTSYKIYVSYKIAHLPPVEEKPQVRFGKLPMPNFPASDVTSSNFSYSIDTTTGGLPKFDKFLKVYFMPKGAATLLAPQKAQVLAGKFKISADPEIISDTNYRFSQDGKILQVQLDTGNFVFNNVAASGEATANNEVLITNFKSFLNSLGLLREEFSGGPAKVTKLGGDSSLISLWPKSIDEKPIITPEFKRALINATVVGHGENLDNYISLEYTFWPIDTTSSSTYPSKSSEAALQDLKTGKGAILEKPDKTDVSITAVYLGYYQAKEYTPYLQPVYVFEGPGYVAITTAIADEYLEAAGTTSK